MKLLLSGAVGFCDVPLALTALAQDQSSFSLVVWALRVTLTLSRRAVGDLWFTRVL